MKHCNIIVPCKGNSGIRIFPFVLASIIISSAIFFSQKTFSADMLIIRHGEAMNNIHEFYSSNSENPGYRRSNLTPVGQVQARLLARDLRKKGYTNKTVSKIVYSPLPRARQTAELLATELGVSAQRLHVDKRLQDVNVGVLEGKPAKNKVKNMEAWLKDNASQGGETKEDVILRVMNVHSEFAYGNTNDCKDGHVLMVTHYRPAYLMLEKITGKKVRLPRGGYAIVNMNAYRKPSQDRLNVAFPIASRDAQWTHYFQPHHLHLPTAFPYSAEL